MYGIDLLQAQSRFSSRLEAGTSDDFAQFLGGLGHLVQLNWNRVEIPRRRSTRAMQIIDANHRRPAAASVQVFSQRIGVRHRAGLARGNGPTGSANMQKTTWSPSGIAANGRVLGVLRAGELNGRRESP